MSTLVDISTARELINTDLSDTALQILLDNADAEIVRQFGEHTTQVDTFESGTYEPLAGEDYPYGLDQFVYPTRPVSEITSIVETYYQTDTTLDPTDYQVQMSGRQILRLTQGKNPQLRWGHRVVVTYTPVDETARRKMVELDLVKLSIQYNALQSERSGDYQVQNLDYDAERKKLLARLRNKRAW